MWSDFFGLFFFPELSEYMGILERRGGVFGYCNSLLPSISLSFSLLAGKYGETYLGESIKQSHFGDLLFLSLAAGPKRTKHM